MSTIDTTFLRASKEAITSPTDYPQSPLSQALLQAVLLGLFLPIHHGGWSSSNLFITSSGGGDIESALSSLPAHTARVKQSAIANGRQVRTLLNPLIVVRETEKEAEEYAQAIIDHADYQSLLDVLALAVMHTPGGDIKREICVMALVVRSAVMYS